MTIQHSGRLLVRVQRAHFNTLHAAGFARRIGKEKALARLVNQASTKLRKRVFDEFIRQICLVDTSPDFVTY